MSLVLHSSIGHNADLLVYILYQSLPYQGECPRLVDMGVKKIRISEEKQLHVSWIGQQNNIVL